MTTNTTESLDERIRFYYNGAKQGADFDKWAAHLKAYFEQEVLRGRVEEAEMYLAVALNDHNIRPNWVAKITFERRIIALNTLLGGESNE